MKNLLILFVVLASGLAFGEGDVLVSKYTGRLGVLENKLFVFDSIGRSYSIVDVFSEPPTVKTMDRKDQVPFYQAIPLERSWLGYGLEQGKKNDKDLYSYNHFLVEFDGEKEDTLWKFDHLNSNSVTDLVQLTDFARKGDSLIISFGSMGFGVLEGASKGLSPVDSMGFRGLTSVDSIFNAGFCKESCMLDTLIQLEQDKSVLPVFGFAMDVHGGDSATLYSIVRRDSSKSDSSDSDAEAVGVKYFSLVKSIPGGNDFQTVPVLVDGKPQEVTSVHVNRNSHTLYVTTSTDLFTSRDGGASFKRITSIPEVLLNTLNRPSFADFGDTTAINLNLKDGDGKEVAGLVFFQGDSLMEDEGAKEYAFLGMQLKSGINAGDIAILGSGGDVIVAVGTNNQGIFFKKVGSGDEWTQLNKVTEVKGSLDEVITFPTVFPPPGNPSVTSVGLGYRLSKTASVDITVYNYAMEKVRTIRTSGERFGGVARSENQVEDRWDGLDDHGHRVAAGMYYILIKSSEGEKGWGKVMIVWGRN